MSLTDKFTQALALAEGKCDISLFLIPWYEGGHPWGKGRLGYSGSGCAWLSTTPEGMLMNHHCCFSHQTTTLSSCCLLKSLQLVLAAPAVWGAEDVARRRQWGKAELKVCSVGEEEGGGRDGGPLESLQHGSSREVDPHETRLYQSSWSWSSVTCAGISFREVKKAGEALQLTVAQKLIIKHRFYCLQSMIPLPWWPVWWIHFNYFGPWLACCIAQGIWNYFDVMSYSENKAHFDYDKINIYVLYFLLLASSSTQFEEKHHSYICPEMKKTFF